MKTRSPYVGVAYYPEAWPETEQEPDIARMRGIGVNLVRMAEFAWSRMEPREGEYDFSWLHRIVAKLPEAEIAIVLCTPTATPPAWLSERHPDILRVSAQGQRMGHGGRRHYCPNSSTYREYSRRIVERMGHEFGDAPGLVAWQIDNEFWEDCYCDGCRQAFHVWLEHRFGTVERLNAAWNTVLWSQEYQNFEQIPLPIPGRVGSGHHPSLTRAYRHFLSDSYVSFCSEQTQVLRAHTSAPITTNAHAPTAHQIDYEALFSELDFVCTDSYAGPSDLARYAFESEWMRPLKGRPFWFMETASTSSGGGSAGATDSFAHVPGSLRAKMWLIYALGGEAVCFWLWRAHWAGQEMEHGSLVYTWGQERINTGEVRQTARELQQHGAWLARSSLKPADFAMHYTVTAQWIFNHGPIADGFRYDPAITAFHRMLLDGGVEPDLISPDHGVDSYKLVYSPYLPTLEPDLVARMQRFVEGGGVWVLGPLSACRTAEMTAYQDAAYSASLEEWLGVHVRHRLPASDALRVVGSSGESSCEWWCDVYEMKSDGAACAHYLGAPLDGMPAVVKRSIGAGSVILLGTRPSDAWLLRLLRDLIPLPAPISSPGIIVTERIYGNGTTAGIIAINTTDKEGHTRSPSGEETRLPPFGVWITPQA